MTLIVIHTTSRLRLRGHDLPDRAARVPGVKVSRAVAEKVDGEPLPLEGARHEGVGITPVLTLVTLVEVSDNTLH